MPFFQDLVPSKVFGEGIFENQAAARAVQYLNSLAGLGVLESAEEQAHRKSTSYVTYSLYPPACASPAAAEKVRKHLDSGVLHKLCKKMVANFFNPLSVDDYTAHGFVPVILGACAMSLGCCTLLDGPGSKMYFKTYKEFLSSIFETARMLDSATVQMKQALRGPEAFVSGTAIDFATYARSPPADNAKPFLMKTCPMLGGMPAGYDFKYKADNPVLAMVGPCSKADMEYGPDSECGGCEKKLEKGMVCAKCKDQTYCSRKCQKEDFKRHKVCCRTPEDRKEMLDGRTSSMWMNQFAMLGSGATSTGGMGGFSEAWSWACSTDGRAGVATVVEGVED